MELQFQCVSLIDPIVYDGKVNCIPFRFHTTGEEWEYAAGADYLYTLQSHGISGFYKHGYLASDFMPHHEIMELIYSFAKEFTGES